MLYNGQALYLRKNIDGLWYVVFDHHEYGVTKFSGVGFKHKGRANAMLRGVQTDVLYITA